MSEETPLASKSEVETYQACKRQWAFKYILRYTTEQTESQKLGDDVDAGQLQPYYRDGREFDYTRPSGYIAASALAHLPPRDTPGIKTQHWFTIPSASSKPGEPAPFGFRGAIDLWVPSRPIPTIYDFKTCKDIKWAKTPAQLLVDPQAQLYATWAMYETGAREVDLVWIYMQTRGARKSKRVHLRVQAEHSASEFQKIDAVASEAFKVRRDGCTEGPWTEDRALSLPPSLEACEAFGGCPYRSKCNLSPDQTIEALTAQAAFRRKEPKLDMNTTGGLFANLAKRNQSTAPQASTPAPTTPPSTHFGDPQTAPAPTEIPAAFLSKEPYGGKPVVGINPPESKLPPAPPVNVATAEPEKPKARRGRPPKATAPSAPTPSAEAVIESMVAEDAAAVKSDPTSLVGVKCHDDLLESRDSVSVTWGEEVVSPVPYQSYRVGPFSATTSVHPGESRRDALRRLNAELSAFAVEEHADKAAAFARALERVGVGK